MEFWGIKVKPGETAKVNPGDEYYLHISQAALGETMGKGNENILIFLKHNGQKLVIGTLSADKCAQIQYDLVVEKEFELSHSSMNTSIYFCGYKNLIKEDDGEGFDYVFDHCESDEEEDIELAQKANGIPELKPKQRTPGQKDVLSDKPNPTSEEPKNDRQIVENVEEDDSDDEDDDDDSSSDDFDEDTTSDDDSDEDMNELSDDDDVDSTDEDDSEDEDVASEDESDDEDETTPVKVEQSKKRPASASKTPVPEKRPKLVLSPLDNQKTGDCGKKVAHTGTPHPAKQGGKGKAAQQSPKSAGSISSFSKTFASDKSHAKAKHRDGK